MEVKVVGTWNGRGVYRASVSRAGIFELEAGLDGAARRRILNVECSEALFEGACRVAVELISGAGFPTPQLPPVAFDAVYAQGAGTAGSSSAEESLRAFWERHNRFAQAVDLGLVSVNERGIASEALALADDARAILPDSNSLLARFPSEPWVLEALGAVCVMSNAYRDAAQVYRRAIALRPDSARAHYNLGTSLMFVGALDEAAHEIQACLSLDRMFWDAYVVQTKLRGYGGIPSDRIATLTQLLDSRQGDRSARQRLHMALGVDYESLGNYRAAFTHFAEGSRARRESVPYSIASDAELFTALQRERVSGGRRGCDDATPIFVIGMPRSGTTLAARILSSHPRIASAGEIKQFGLLLKRMSGSSTRALLDSDTVARAHDLDWHELGRRYLDYSCRIDDRCDYVIDKFPHNFLYVQHILTALPRARVISLRRGAMDTCLANFREEFANDSSFHAYASGLDDIVEYYKMYNSLMEYWRTRFGDQILEVSYEGLVTDTDAAIRRMLGFLDVEWNSACNDFEVNGSSVSTASAVQVRQPIYESSIGRWKHYVAELGMVADRLTAAKVPLDVV